MRYLRTTKAGLIQIDQAEIVEAAKYDGLVTTQSVGIYTTN